MPTKSQHSSDMRAFMHGSVPPRQVSPVGEAPSWMRPPMVVIPDGDLIPGDPELCAPKPDYRLEQQDGATLKVRMLGAKLANAYYTVELVDGAWPSQQSIINACDRGTNFGGVVTFNDNTHAHVEVWTD